MTHPVHSLAPRLLPEGLDERWLTGLMLLRTASHTAGQLERDPWEFAVEWRELRAAGLTVTDLRWLLAGGYVVHGIERLHPRKTHREFARLASLAIPARACFILTPDGLLLTDQLAALAIRLGPEPDDCQTPIAKPNWDSQLRRLSWQGRLVKQFRTPALNQEAILSAFQEEGWPPRIDDPLPGSHGQDAKQRLHDAIRSLNRNQVYRLAFSGDGTGQGVVWGQIEAASPARPQIDYRFPVPSSHT